MSNVSSAANGTATKQSPVTVTDPKLSACLGFVQQADGARAAAPFGDVSLTPAERKGALKLPPKGAKMVTGLAGLWQQYGAALPTVDLGQMSGQLLTSQDLRTVWRAAKLVARALDDGALEAEKQVWSTATQIYTLLQTIARKDKTLAVALEPYAQYFQEGAKTAKADKKAGRPPKRSRKPKATPPPAKTPPATAEPVLEQKPASS